MLMIASVLLFPKSADPKWLLSPGTPAAIFIGYRLSRGVYLPDPARQGWGYLASVQDNQWVMLQAPPGDVYIVLAWQGQGVDSVARNNMWSLKAWVSAILHEKMNRADWMVFHDMFDRYGDFLFLDTNDQEVQGERA